MTRINEDEDPKSCLFGASLPFLLVLLMFAGRRRERS